MWLVDIQICTDPDVNAEHGVCPVQQPARASKRQKKPSQFFPPTNSVS